MEYKIKNAIILIDEDDLSTISKHNWSLQRTAKNSFYVKSTCRKKIYLHRLIINTPKGLFTDHINGNRLDNRKENLRVCTIRQNNRNKLKTIKKCSSKYKGVTFRKKATDNPWEASIEINNKYIYLGNYKTEIDAAKAYDKKALELFDEFAKVNFPIRSGGECAT